MRVFVLVFDPERIRQELGGVVEDHFEIATNVLEVLEVESKLSLRYKVANQSTNFQYLLILIESWHSTQFNKGGPLIDIDCNIALERSVLLKVLWAVGKTIIGRNASTPSIRRPPQWKGAPKHPPQPCMPC